MKHAITIFLLIYLPSLIAGQSLIKSVKVDEFTGNKVVESKWVSMKGKFGKYNWCFTRLRKIDKTTVLDLKLATGKVVSVDSGEKLLFKTSKDTVLKFSNHEYTVSCRGCGAIGLKGGDAQGVYLHIILSPDQLNALQTEKITKLRLYTNDGYMEQDVKEVSANELKLCAIQIGRH